MTAPRAAAVLPARRPVAAPEPGPARRPTRPPRPPHLVPPHLVPPHLVPPHLVVVPDPSAARARSRARLATVAATVLAAAGLFGVVGLHVLLAEGQAGVAGLEQRLEAEQERNQELRLQVATMESPAAVVSTARQRLGMAPPSTVVPLAPLDPPATAAPPGAPPGPGRSELATAARP
jgi:cell division protein FtsB